ncbi:MAG: 2-C-methyl-D-erythritol 2,4-cyclodiphosphate synthase [Melioribacteraceae bacterium]|nr:2-C-methyl-D-erythritol 2,4-cyclodiphosphate synthase [Melioribacteraceae bacterium]
MQNIRIGFGYDVHQLSKDRKLFLGGIEIPSELGLLGHSDADVLLHAVCDALLGALALGDIGKHFPNNDPKFKDIDSKILLKESYKLVKEKGFTLGNLDASLVLEKPKILPHLEKIKLSISSILECSTDQVSIKATTSEKLGFVGREEGAEAYATVLLFKID